MLLLGAISCNQTNQKSNHIDENKHTTSAKVIEVMTEQKQRELTPEEVLTDLLQGNERFVSDRQINRNLPKQISSTTKKQYPKAVVLACIDSRVPVEYIFDQGIGDIFVVRVAGNIEDKALLGSMEYGLGIAGSKLLMVLGHENCGAVKSAIKKLDVGSDNVSVLLNQAEPAILEIDGERDDKNKEYFDAVVKNNVYQTIEDIRNRSSIINNLEDKGEIKIVGAFYSLTDGKVTIIRNDTHEHDDD
ncbi:carbonic anhydrase [Echinicola soli]|uniref:Carbonic anhydrase n=2 Tax=Echinicola soli TaxID=2591634 RepID=A0A514CPD7_9BACT|nr:carbonic anhydrase [Echinicola soli]